MALVKAPWTEDQVRALNRHQRNPMYHPFTCGSGNRKSHPDGEGVLEATRDGWRCPYCPYRQDWAHDTMLAVSGTLPGEARGEEGTEGSGERGA